MPPRAIPLSDLEVGITRLRPKGGASPSALYDLLNGFIDNSGAPTSRDGTAVDTILPAGTIGLCAFEGKQVVFAQSPVTMTDSNYVCMVLINPNASSTATLSKIWFAKPFLGYLYVVAGFSDGTTVHYWLQSPAVWTPNTVYGANATVLPETPNGFYYEAITPVNAPTWQPSTAYTVGDTVQPSTPNGYLYTVTDVAGTAPTSGTTEPTWPTSSGAQVYETTDNSSTPSTSTVASGATTQTVPPSVIARYGTGLNPEQPT